MRPGTGIDLDLTPSSSLEWLETNGLGDYAQGTATGANTRRYHGLLVANLPHMDRHVLLSTVEDWLCIDTESIPLSSRYHPGCVYPQGQNHLKSWQASPCPTFVYEVAGLRVTRRIALVHGSHTVLIRYTVEATSESEGALLSGSELMLRVTPLLAFRRYHDLTHANMDLHVKTFPIRSGFKIQPYNALPPIYIRSEGLFDFLPSPEWINTVEYPVERERGFDYQEDLFSPGLFEIHVMPGDDIILSASLDEQFGMAASGIPEDLHTLWDAEIARRSAPQETGKRKAKNAGPLCSFLAAQSEDFLMKTPGGRSLLLAGYPWFGSWGRDTLIALPGTTFLAGRLDEGLAILRTIALNACDGLIPNTFDGDGQPRGFNSVDASLWFAWDCQLMLKVLSKDPERTQEFLDLCAPTLYSIIAAYRAGRVPFTRVATSGLLEVGTPSTQLTWMDAQVNGRPVTPRNGFPVEIQALWYNTLAFAHSLAKKREDPDPCTSRELKALRAAFAAHFTLPDGSLCDVWRAPEDGVPDTSLRPNQLLAVSMPEPIAPKSSWKAIVDLVGKKLLTPFGLRTLSPDDPAFCPVYAGGPAQRDGAYHQGTVWPWLLGPYTDALLKAEQVDENGEKEKSRRKPSRAVKQLLETITPLVTTHLREAGVGHMSEIFSATAPYAPDGTTAQAWSEAEVYRMLLALRAADRETYEGWEKTLPSFS